MNNKKIAWIAFAVLLLLQLWVPASMIFKHEFILKNGKAFKFRSAPIDPYDPFRGKYLILHFDENSFEDKVNNNWKSNESIYVSLATDDSGFAKIKFVQKTNAGLGNDYIKAKVDYLGYDSAKVLYIEWPFTRFYMEERKAEAAETAYTQALIDSNNQTYALIKVKEGGAVLENVFINDKPIISYIKK